MPFLHWASVYVFRMQRICSVFFLSPEIAYYGCNQNVLPINQHGDWSCAALLSRADAPGHSIGAEGINLLRLHAARLLRYAVSFGITAQDGEDIVQDTFLALFHHLQRGRSGDNLHGWLFRVTHNLALKRRMKILNEPAGGNTEELEILDPNPNPEERMLFGERHARLASVLQAFPIEDQSCLRVRAGG